MSLSKNEIKFLSSLQQKKYRDEEGLFIVEGPKMVAELLNQKKFEIERIYGVESWFAEQLTPPLHTQISQKELERISAHRHPNEVLATVKIPVKTELILTDSKFVLLLDGVSDPGNLGTILRTAEWFGLTDIIASKESAELFNPKVIQSSMGAIFRIAYHRTDLNSVCAELKSNGFQILLADMDGSAVESTTFAEKTTLIMGNESRGSHSIDKNLIDDKITIKSIGKTESLNVAIACGIILHQYNFAKLG